MQGEMLPNYHSKICPNLGAILRLEESLDLSDLCMHITSIAIMAIR